MFALFQLKARTTYDKRCRHRPAHTAVANCCATPPRPLLLLLLLLSQLSKCGQPSGVPLSPRPSAPLPPWVYCSRRSAAVLQRPTTIEVSESTIPAAVCRRRRRAHNPLFVLFSAICIRVCVGREYEISDSSELAGWLFVFKNQLSHAVARFINTQWIYM